MKSKSVLKICLGISALILAACSSESDSNPIQTPSTDISENVVLDSAINEVNPILPDDNSLVNPTQPDTQPDTNTNQPDVSLPTLEDTTVTSIDTTPYTPPSNNETITTPSDENVNYVYYGAELTGLDSYLYGRFEARMKMAATEGTVSSMFLYYNNSHIGGGEKWNEIDIEVLGKLPKGIQSNIISGTAEKQVQSAKKHSFEFDTRDDYHLYAITWTPEYISWEIDSVEIRRDTLGMTKGQIEYLTEPQSLRFNLWASSNKSWVGAFTGDALPIEQTIDYVRAYSYDASTKNFKLEWQDDFEGDDLNYDRWSKGTWDMELVTYRKENIRVENGHAVIVLNKEAK